MSKELAEIREFVKSDLLAAIDGQLGSDEAMLAYLKDKADQLRRMVDNAYLTEQLCIGASRDELWKRGGLR